MKVGWEHDTDDVEQERIPAGCPRTPAVSVSNCRQRVRHGQHGIKFLFFPVLEPPCTIVFALPDEGIDLLDVFRAPALDERRIDFVAKNVAVEPGTKLDQESGETKCEYSGPLVTLDSHQRTGNDPTTTDGRFVGRWADGW